MPSVLGLSRETKPTDYTLIENGIYLIDSHNQRLRSFTMTHCRPERQRKSVAGQSEEPEASK